MEDILKIHVYQIKQNGGYSQNPHIRLNKMEDILKIHVCQMKQNGGYS